MTLTSSASPPEIAKAATAAVDSPAAAAASALEFGIGARVSLSVMRDDYVDVITDALGRVDTAGLVLETDEVSTYVGGSEPAVVRFVTQLLSAAAASGAHVSAHILFSRGCPGEVTCEVTPGARAGETLEPAHPVGITASAQWSLYPLEDSGTAGRQPDHMRDIYAAIEHAKAAGTFAGSEHFVTRLRGDLAEVVDTAARGWMLVGRTVSHVTSHLVVSVNSPSAEAKR